MEIGRHLFAACSAGNIETVKDLLDREKLRGARITDSATLHGIINQQYEDRETPLFVAAKQGYFEIVEILLRHHADVNSVNGDEESTALIVAIQGGHQDIVQLLLECEGIHPNVQTKTKKWSALMFACEKGQTNTVKILLKKGAEVDMGDIKETALMIACERGYTEIAELLLEYGASDMIDLLAGCKYAKSEKKYNLPHKTALMLASRGGHTKTVKVLLLYGATVNIQTEEDGWSALMFASEKGYTETAELLLEYGAEVDLLGSLDMDLTKYDHVDRDQLRYYMRTKLTERDIFGMHMSELYSLSGFNRGRTTWTTKGVKCTSLMIASNNGHTETIEMLVKHAANVNMQSEGCLLTITDSEDGLAIHHTDTTTKGMNGWTALMIASRKGDLKSTKLILDYGAKIDVQGLIYYSIRAWCENWWTALMIASGNGSYETVKLLLDHGANVNMQSKDDRWSALMLASLQGYTEVAELLLEYGAEVDLFGSVCDVEPTVNLYHDPAMLRLSQECSNESLKDKNQWTALMLASTNGHKGTAALLLKYGANVNMQPGGPWTALLLASKNKHIEMVQLLLLHGAKVNMQGNTTQKHDYVWTALTLSSRNGHIEIIEILLKHGASEVSSALLAAAIQLQEKTIELLLAHGANINFQNNEGTSALMLAGSERIIELLLKHGANVNLQNNEGTSALMFVSQNVTERESLLSSDVIKSTGMAELLLRYGANINLQNNKGMSALMLVVQEDNIELVKMLLKYGTNVNLQDSNGWSALMFASQTGNTEMMTILLKHRASVYLRTIPNGMTALMIASEAGKLSAVKLLLENGAYINTLNSDRCSALIIANKKKHDGITDLLLNHGAKKHVVHTKPHDQGWFTLMIACENGFTGRVKQLLKQGVNVNKANEDDGWSPLMIVCRTGHTEIAKLLLDHGARIEMQNSKGWPAMLVASQYGHYEIIKLLLEYGTHVNMLHGGKASVLMIAAQYGHVEIIKQLVLEDGASVDL